MVEYIVHKYIVYTCIVYRVSFGMQIMGEGSTYLQ